MYTKIFIFWYLLFNAPLVELCQEFIHRDNILLLQEDHPLHIGRISKDKMNSSIEPVRGSWSKIINFSVYPTTTDSFNPTLLEFCPEVEGKIGHFPDIRVHTKKFIY